MGRSYFRKEYGIHTKRSERIGKNAVSHTLTFDKTLVFRISKNGRFDGAQILISHIHPAQVGVIKVFSDDDFGHDRLRTGGALAWFLGGLAGRRSSDLSLG